ncbi:MAG TPA: hypothetical protein VG433_01780 [Pirellulales bacterium]|nr:hypothetical protein [Pirellulales bacterium]
MSVGPIGAAGSFAGIPLAQTHGSETDRVAQESVAFERQIRSQALAADAAGIAASDSEENQTHDRDADGRRLWERPTPASESEAEAEVVPQPEPRHDSDSESGTQLDLTG